MTRVIFALMTASVLLAAQTPAAPATAVGTRRVNQQKRIGQGVSNGTMTAKETAKVENKEHAINKQVAADRAANGGRLTPGEKVQVNKEQNKVSSKIYKDKHNAATQPK